MPGIGATLLGGNPIPASVQGRKGANFFLEATKGGIGGHVEGILEWRLKLF